MVLRARWSDVARFQERGTTGLKPTETSFILISLTKIQGCHLIFLTKTIWLGARPPDYNRFCRDRQSWAGVLRGEGYLPASEEISSFLQPLELSLKMR